MATSAVSASELAELRRQAWDFVRRRSGLSRRLKKLQAEQLVLRRLAELEHERRLVQPVQGGLIARQGSLIVAPHGRTDGR